MKRFVIFSLVIVSLAGCQRGEEDPVISLVSRKGRLSGDWNVTSYTASRPGETISYDGTNVTYNYADSLELTIPMEWTMTFEREGAYTSVKTEDYPENVDAGTAAYTQTTEENGVWEFTGGNDSPNKSQLLFLVEEFKVSRTDQGSNISVISVENPNSGLVYDMVKLSSQEMTLKYETVVSDAFGQTTESAEIKLSKQ